LGKLTGRLEHEGDGVGPVVGLDGDDVVVSGAAEHLGHVVEVHAHGEVAVAAVVLEPLGAEEQRDERDVAGIHGLQREPRPGAVEVGVGDQLPDRLQDLLEEAPLHKPQLGHRGGALSSAAEEEEKGESGRFGEGEIGGKGKYFALLALEDSSDRWVRRVVHQAQVGYKWAEYEACS
jgi:hypothetical protein